MKTLGSTWIEPTVAGLDPTGATPRPLMHAPLSVRCRGAPIALGPPVRRRRERPANFGAIMEDQTILDRITALVDEEHKLREDAIAPEANAARLKSVAEQLDQCWDLLRQRRAKREFGADPETAAPRDVGTVENYTN
jgi:hypothetical protein